MLFNPDDIFLSQKLKIKSRYSTIDQTFGLYHTFVKITKINPESVFIYNDAIIFFFVKNSEYFKAKWALGSLKKYLRNKKVLIIRAEQTLLRLLFSFFPDTYIHDIGLDFNEKTNEKVITVGFLSFEHRGIAVGRNGDYIKAINEIFRRFVNFEALEDFKVKIQVEYIKL